MSKRFRIGVLLCLVPALGLPAWAQFTDEEVAEREAMEHYLVDAKIVDSEQMSPSEGVTEPYRLNMKKDDLERSSLWKNPSGRMKGFWEGWKYEIAAYRLDKYFDLNMVPPTVERRFRGTAGSCQLWIEVWDDLLGTTEKGLYPPPERSRHWNNMAYLQRAFDNLIGNTDRHLRNILITEDWRMILIDHSRSFRIGKKYTKKLVFDAKHADGPKLMKRLPREFVDKLKALDAAKLREVVGDYLTDEEAEAVILRKALVLAEIDRLIGENGESPTLY